MQPLEMSCCGCPIVHFVYAAPLTLRMLPSENRCRRKVIGFVHDLNDGYRCITDSKNVACGNELLPMPNCLFRVRYTGDPKMLTSENCCTRKIIGFVHDLNGGYRF